MLQRIIVFFLCCLFYGNSSYAQQCFTQGGIGSYDGFDPLEAWFTATQGNGVLEIDSNTYYTAGKSLKVTVNETSNWKVRMFNNASCYFETVAGETYTVSFYMKTQIGNSVTVTMMDALDNDVALTVLSTQSDWKLYTVDLVPTIATTSGRLKLNFNTAGTYFIDEITINDVPEEPEEVVLTDNNWYVSPNGSDFLSNDNGLSTSKPLKTIQYAINSAWHPGDTIFVMDGTYRNANFGSGNLNNGPIVNLDANNAKGVATGPLVITNYPGHSPKLEFDGAGGFVGNNEYLVISGFEIEGPNQRINYEEAFANRLIQDNYYKGRGIAIWSGHHITIKNNIIHDCPNSGIRVNKGDYCEVSYNTVYNNTWWSSNAESALVFAESKDIDTKSIIKMRITNNLAYDNYNNIPYYNSTYDQEAESPYGTYRQDYIIDGSGCYVTRNRDTYFYGWYYFANNIMYGNGINGLVVHKTDRAIVTNNTSYMNGAVPLSSGRQSSSGITVNGSADVKMYNNISWPRFDNDYGYKIYDKANSENFEASNNILVKGRTDFGPGTSVTVDPLFVDAANFDFRLQADSQALNAGLQHGNIPINDFYDVPREDEIIDIGAVEAVDLDDDGTYDHLSLGDSLLGATFRVYPNPTIGVVFLSESVPYSLHKITGEVLLKSHGDYLDLSLFTDGVYILHTQMGAFKIVKY
ncbi:MAG: carbohydrate binding domain-containing protein [Flavicella sp.]